MQGKIDFYNFPGSKPPNADGRLYLNLNIHILKLKINTFLDKICAGRFVK